MDICPTLICVFILYAYKLKGVKMYNDKDNTQSRM